MIDSPRLHRFFEKPPHPEAAAILERFRYRRYVPGGCLPSPKNAEGRTLCRWCRTPVEGRRQHWCSDWCKESYWTRASGPAAASRAIERDGGQCRSCRYPMADVARVYGALFSRANARRRYLVGSHDRHLGPSARANARLEMLRRWSARRGIELDHETDGWRHGLVNLVEVDHVIPVVDGGGSCALSNLRTLCVRCHRAETKKLAARRALRRKAARAAAKFLLTIVLAIGEPHARAA